MSNAWLDNPQLALPEQQIRSSDSLWARLSDRALLRQETVHLGAVPNRIARIALWQAWKKGSLEGVFARFLDEWLLRKDAHLQPYWSLRDRGHLVRAQDWLLANVGTVAAKVQFETSRPDVRTHIALRVSDLLILAPGGASHDVAAYALPHRAAVLTATALQGHARAGSQQH
jgi:hypothetical protein